MKKIIKATEAPKRVVRRGMFANPQQEAVQGNSMIANPIQKTMRPEAPELRARREVQRNQG